MARPDHSYIPGRYSLGIAQNILGIDDSSRGDDRTLDEVLASTIIPQRYDLNDEEE